MSIPKELNKVDGGALLLNGFITVGKDGSKYGYSKTIGASLSTRDHPYFLVDKETNEVSLFAIYETTNISLITESGMSIILSSKNDGVYSGVNENITTSVINHSGGTFQFIVRSLVEDEKDLIIEAIVSGKTNKEIKSEFGMSAAKVNLIRKEIEDGTNSISNG
jgi:hypothetical protein